MRWQEEIGLDVLVHGEFERNDMVKYFGEQLERLRVHPSTAGCSPMAAAAWRRRSSGATCRGPTPMTVRWSAYAQSRTRRPMKGMLTGPVTMLQWSFVRDDLPRAEVCRQIALAIRDEVADLEAAGIEVIQVDEPAFREGLPLRQAEWADYLEWAVACFRLATCCVAGRHQIHTHMCYSEFNDIMPAIADMDADAISIETTRSRMELLDAFAPAAGGRTARIPRKSGLGFGTSTARACRTPMRWRRLLRLAAAAAGGLADLGQSGLRAEDAAMGGGEAGAAGFSGSRADVASAGGGTYGQRIGEVTICVRLLG